jgi:hypothetical protein
MFCQRKPTWLTMDREVHRLLINNVDAIYQYWLLPWSQHNVPKCNLVIGDY